MNKNLNIISEEVIAQNDYVIFKKLVYTDKNGNIRDWFITSRKNCDNAVVIVAMIPGEKPKLIVTKEFRVPLGDYEWGFPAGLIDEGETIKNAAIRELKEETGLEVEYIISISPFIYN